MESKLKRSLASTESAELSSLNQSLGYPENSESARLRPRDIRRKQLAEKNRLKEDPIYVDLEVPFSATPFYDYFDNFVLGFKIETDVPSSSDCIDALVFTVDDYTYFQNNITL